MMHGFTMDLSHYLNQTSNPETAEHAQDDVVLEEKAGGLKGLKIILELEIGQDTS